YQDNFNRANSVNNLGSAQDAFGAPLSWSLRRFYTNTSANADVSVGFANTVFNKLTINCAGNGPGAAANNNDIASFYVNSDLDGSKTYSTNLNYTHLNGTLYDVTQIGSQRNGGFFILPRAEGNDFPGNSGWVIRRTADAGNPTITVGFYSGAARSGGSISTSTLSA